jgi:hypothetical protein
VDRGPFFSSISKGGFCMSGSSLLNRIRSSAALGRRRRSAFSPLLVERLEERNLLSGWSSLGHDPQHTGVADVASQSLQQILWQTPVDLNPQYREGDLLIHYGSPLVTAANTIIVPVKTGTSDNFQVEGHSAVDGSTLWSQTTDYHLPPHNWTPSFGPTVDGNSRLYLAGNGGTILYMNSPDNPGATISGRLAFFGLNNYNANPTAYNNAVFIDTPITADAAGNIYFGFLTTADTPLHLRGGIARIDANGTGTWVSAATAANDGNMEKVAMNSAPALSNDGSTLYVAVNSHSETGYLLALNSTTLATVGRVAPQDVRSGRNAIIPDDGSASPTVGPDGDVYFGVLDNPLVTDKGWMLHFSGDLSQTKTPGAFGWDDTVSIVDSSLVPSYQGSSSYLIFTKYNNYAGITDGDGVNKLAILDPNDTQIDARTGTTVMREVMTLIGPTPDPDFIQHYPDAVREWCINDAAIDPYSGSVLASSEDGFLYRWDLTSGQITESIDLGVLLGAAYTPTAIGLDGTVYAMNNATLFAVGSSGQAPRGGHLGTHHGAVETQLVSADSAELFPSAHLLSPSDQFVPPPRAASAELYPVPIEPTSQLAVSPDSAGRREDDLVGNQSRDARVEPDLVGKEDSGSESSQLF